MKREGIEIAWNNIEEENQNLKTFYICLVLIKQKYNWINKINKNKSNKKKSMCINNTIRLIKLLFFVYLLSKYIEYIYFYYILFDYRQELNQLQYRIHELISSS